MEHITNKHSNLNWQCGNQILILAIRNWEQNYLAKQILWQNASSLLLSIETLANLKSEVIKDWNDQLVETIHNNAKYKHILTTPTS